MGNAKTRAALISVISNSILIVLKVCAGILSGSVSILSEAIHSGMDLVASFIALFSVSISSKPPDKQHPYGHGKIENISGTIEGILILVAAILIISEAIKKLNNPHPLNETTIAIVVMLFSAIINWFVSSYLYKVAKKEDSVALEADALHLRTDVYTSAGVGFGIILIEITGFVLLDPLVAIFVASLILKESFKLCRKAFNPLLDTKLPEGEELIIVEVLDKYNDQIQVHGYHNLKTRQSGSQRYAEFHLEVDPSLSIQEYQTISEGIQDDLCYSLDNICITIHVETRSF
ncbi:MAG: cation transporter [Gracilibacter sp. BRH_c7a]|nr:MAG: cation transporter [Gracilibacter sp. BRH_c7a]